ALARFLKPRMLVGSVVDDQVNDDPQTALIGLVQKLDDITQRSETGIDLVVIGDIIAVILHRRGEEWHQPQAGYAEAGQVIQPASEAGEVSDPVTVGVHESLYVKAIDDCILIPE